MSINGVNDTWVEDVARGIRLVRGHRDQRTFSRVTDTGQQTISYYERGRIPKNWRFLAKLAEEGVDLNDLLTGRLARRGGNGR